jgi:hypothetical protein
MIMFLIVKSSVVYSQNFTKIATGDIVNDAGNSGGSSWIDFDNDGYLDLFVANGNQDNQNNQLFRNNHDGTFIKIITGELVNNGGSSIGGTWGDYDNDGDADLYVTNRALASGSATINFLYLNNGDGTFTRITDGVIANDPADSNISSWIDIENDGDLDLFVVNFNQANFLYMNNGDGTFTKNPNGVINQTSLSISAVWGDFNNDGYLDLFIGNGGSTANLLFRNNKDGTFTQITSGAPVTDIASTLGFLYLNEGPPNYTFSKVTVGNIVNDGGFSVGSAWGDIDNDGDLDLYIGNFNQNNFLYLNNGDSTFQKISNGSIVEDVGATFGVSMADYDKDGDIDLYATNINNQNNFFYTNDGNQNNWIRLECIGTNSNKSAIGTKVKIKVDSGDINSWQMREITSQSGYNSQNSLIAEFGVKNAAVVDSIKIEWPSTIVDIYTDVPINAFYQAIENTSLKPIITSVNKDEFLIPEDFELYQNYPNPFNPSTEIKYILPNSGFVDLKIYNIRGREIKILISGFQSAGTNSVIWDGKDNFGETVNSGIYIFKIRVGELTKSQKMMLIK